jgi:2-phosphosulfolactate phosphatase
MVKILHGSQGARQAASDGDIAVVVDALRASATISSLFQKSIENLYVCHNEEEARALALEMPAALLAGEQDTKKPQGFDFFNSPVEVGNAEIAGKTVIFTSSNGAKMLIAAKGAREVIIGGLANAQVVTSYLEHSENDISIVASGDNGIECDEDSYSAAYLAHLLDEHFSSTELNRWQKEIDNERAETVFRQSNHGKKLLRLGCQEDLVCCATVDKYAVIPVVCEYISLQEKTVARLKKADI